MHTPKRYFVYIMTNRSKTLYTGVTNNLIRRVREHKTGVGSSFAAKHKLDRLVYFERFQDIRNAIEREKRIKGWLRIKKIALIVSVNPEWRDLSSEWYEHHQFEPGTGDILNAEPQPLHRSFAARNAAQDDNSSTLNPNVPARLRGSALSQS